jgi:pimeloyl-ACP methyl ester carboxylesterase
MEQLSVDAGGTRLCVRVWGERDAYPVLCWHGVGLASLGSGFVVDAAPLLASRHGLRIVALDAPGFGGSPPLERDGYRPRALVELVPPLLDELGLAHVAFLGFSWGGDIGCHLAAVYPGVLKALVVLDAGYSDRPLEPWLTYEQRLERRTDEARRTVPTVAPSVVAAIEYGMAHAPPSATRPRIAASELPVLLVAAGHAPEEELAQFSADVPQAEVVRVAGAGHDVLADGGPAVVELVGAWLERAWRERRL